MLSLVSLHGDSGSSSLECDNCESGDPPVNRCATCCHFLCEFCTAGHKRGRKTKNHHLLSLEEAKEEGSAAVTRPSLCKEHDGEILKLFCETCDEAICRDCTIVKHREHNYTFVKDAFSNRKDGVMKVLLETKTKASTLQNALDRLSEIRDSIQSRVEETVQDITIFFNDLTVCIDTRCDELINEAKELGKTKLKSLEIQQEELKTALGILQSSVEFTEKAFKNGNEVEILSMHGQISARLQDLNSAKLQLKPCADDAMKFEADNQLKQDIANSGVITDVVTHAGTSTVTMEHGLEGVMYNTLCGQSVKFTIIAKEQNGRKRTEGGDLFVAHCVDGTELEFLDVRDVGDGTYTFSYTPTSEGWCKLAVKLMGLDVRGSPFSWFVEKWHLLCISESSEGQIQLSDQNMTAQYKLKTASPFGSSFVFSPAGSSLFGGTETAGFDFGGGFGVGSSAFGNMNTNTQSFGFSGGTSPANSQFGSYSSNTGGRRTTTSSSAFGGTCTTTSSAFTGSSAKGSSFGSRGSTSRPVNANRYPYVVSSICFNTGKHLCKAEIKGNIQEGFSFGVISSSQGSHGTLAKLGNWWLWNSTRMKRLFSSSNIPIQQSSINQCTSSDVIEMYLDCDDGTLMMYNQRTKESDIWHEVQGDVCPVFHMTTDGDQVYLLL